MERLFSVTRFLSLCALSFTLAGCGMTGVYGDWDAPTEFRFASLTENETNDFAQVFERHEVVYTREDTREHIVFRVQQIDSTWHLTRIMHSLRKKARQLNIESDLETVAFEYGGLNTSAVARVTVSITVPRGASACIADGPARDPWRSVNVSRNGTWTGEVNQSGIVAEQDGWVYVAATRDGEFHRYFRVNVITGQQQRVDYATVRGAGLEQPKGCAG